MFGYNIKKNMIIRVPRIDELEKKSHRYIGLMSVLPHLSDYRNFSVNHILGLTTTVYDSVNEYDLVIHCICFLTKLP